MFIQIHERFGEFLDIEREIELSGPIHTKGVLILQSLLANRVAKTSPLLKLALPSIVTEATSPSSVNPQ